MSNIDDGGPAFPRGGDNFGRTREGMSLRDWFAGQALAALATGEDAAMRAASIQKSGDRTGFDDMPHADCDATYASRLAEDAYIIADAMLAARAPRRRQAKGGRRE